MRGKKFFIILIFIILVITILIYFFIYKIKTNINENFLGYGKLINIVNIGDNDFDKDDKNSNLDLLKNQNNNNNNNKSNISKNNTNNLNNNINNAINTTIATTGNIDFLSKDNNFEDAVKKTNIYITYTNISNSYFSTLNEYIKKANFLLKGKYKFIVIKSKELNNNNTCQFGYRKNNILKELSIIDKSNGLVYSELIKNFNKIKETNNDKLIIISDTKDFNLNCNNQEVIKNDIKSIGKDNNNIIIFINLNGSGNEIIKDYYNQLAIYTGVNIINIDSSIDLRNKLNDFIYPLEDKLELNTDTFETNTYIEFFDEKGNNYQAELTVFKKEGGLFKPIEIETYTKAYKKGLDAGIYKFLAYDPVTNIYLETEPVIINKVNKFNYTFTFRKTKLYINIFDENKNPILGDIRIKGIERKNITINNFNKKSSVILDVNPGNYEISIKTSNNFIFNDNFIVNGEQSIKKDYNTIKQKVKISVVNQDNVKIDNTIISIMRGNNIYDSKKGNDIEFQLPLGEYMIIAKDPISGNNFSKKIAINSIGEANYIKNISIILESFPVMINLGDKGYIIELYNNINLNKPFQTITGTGIKNLKLAVGEYKYKVYNRKKEFLYEKKFTVDDFIRNEIIINENNS